MVILTVIKEELLACKIAFGIGPDTRENRRVGGYRCWHTTVADSEGASIAVVLSMVGEARNVPCANACERLLASYDARLCILVGIAAGLKTKVKAGDCVAASYVLDYEGARRETEDRKRPRPFPVNPLVRHDLDYFDPASEGWHEDLRACLATVASRP